jgi:GTPase SAR1 family protein
MAAKEYNNLDILSISSINKLQAVSLRFDKVVETDWKELFNGYQRLYAITYSSSSSFINKLLPMFEEAEIIFGYEKVLHGLADILAYQQAALSELRSVFGIRDKELLDRVDNGTLRLFLLRDRISHKKTFLLESDSGKRKVITGSANLSGAAFSGDQLENVFVIEDALGYKYFMDEFKSLKQHVDNIDKGAILFSDETSLENLPIANTIKTRKVVVLEKCQQENNDSKFFVLKADELAKKYCDVVPKPDRNGKILLNPSEIKKVARNVRSATSFEVKTERRNPQFIIDIDNKKAVLDGDQLDLTPPSDEIGNDVGLFMEYMQGFQDFKGDVPDLLETYYSLANWFFSSPFVSIMRNAALKLNKNMLFYPAYAVIYGQSNAGKTKFLATLLTMMFGEAYQSLMLSANEFTKTKATALKREIKGVPIVIDDIEKQRFDQHAVEIIKTDYFIADNYPCIAISTNTELTYLRPEISKRVVACQAAAALPRLEAFKNNIVERIQKSIGTSFYRAYLKTMIDILPEKLNQLFSNDITQPDLLKISSCVLKQIIENHYEKEVPSWVREYNIEYYFGQMADKGLVTKIKERWKTEPRKFKVNRKKDELIIDIGDQFEVRRIRNELPTYVFKFNTKTKLVLNLTEAEEFFDITFRRRRWF